MSELANLLWAIAAVVTLLLVAGLLYFPPKPIRDLFARTRLKNFKLGRLFQAELDDQGPENQDLVQEDVAPRVESRQGGHQVAYSSDEHDVEDESSSKDGLSLILDGRYKDGLGAVEASGEWETSEDDAESLALALYLVLTRSDSEPERDRVVAKLERVKALYPENLQICRLTAWALREMGFRDRADQVLFDYLQKVADPESRSTIVADWAKRLSEKGDNQAAIQFLREEIRAAASPKIKSKLLVALASRYEEQEPADSLKIMSTLELALEHQPLDRKLRFDVAYKYSEGGMPAFSLRHYQDVISHNQKHGVALNNAGVVAHDLSLPVLGTNYYLSSMEQGETLAYANVGFLYLEKGLVDDAREVLDKARELENCDERVFIARSEAETSGKSEQEKLAQWLRVVEKVQHWRRLYAEYSLETAQADLFDGLLEGFPLVVELSQDGRVVKGWFRFDSEGRKYALRGHAEGRALRFTWSEDPPEDLSFQYFLRRREGHGLLLFEGDAFRGLSLEGKESADASALKEIKEWRLENS